MASTVLDTNRNCAPVAACLVANHFVTVFRYYSEFTSQPQKRLTAVEATALGRAGLRLGVVYQDGGAQGGAFTHSKGFRAGRYVYDYAQATIHQPPNSAIYFAVDFDASRDEIKNGVVPFFKGIAEGFLQIGGSAPDYQVGVYGSGLVCSTLLNGEFATRAWVSQSMGFTGTKDFLKTNRWHLKQNLPSTLCGISVDTDDVNPAKPDIGDFAPDLGALQPDSGATEISRRFVIARDGLNLRGGPGTAFAKVRTLALGTSLFVLALDGDWAMVDLMGDGAADGFCFAKFLASTPP